MQIYLPIAEMPVSVLLILGLGGAVGFISGLFGVGGGFLMTPLLIFIGIPPSVAVATQTAQIVASSTTSVLSAHQRKAVDFKLGGYLVAGGLIGSVFGVNFFTQAKKIGQLDLVIVICYVTLFTIVGSLMLRESISEFFKKRKIGVNIQKMEEPVRVPFQTWPLKVNFEQSGLYISILPFLFLSIFIGFIGALLGIGGAFMLVPALLYIFRVPIAVVVGTSQFQIFSSTLLAMILHSVKSQSVDIVLALLLIIGGVLGAQFGQQAGRALKAEMFRFLLALLLLSVGLRFAYELVMTPKEPFSISILEGNS